MESLLSGNKLAEELEFVKRHAELIASQKLKYPSTYVPPLEDRHKKATLADIPVCQPPAGVSEDKPAAIETVTLTIKSLKPPLLFTLTAPSTSTISTLKALLSSSEPTAPPPDAQRWILKGKAMGDGKLLREFDVENSAVVNLMVKAVAAPVATSPPPPEAHVEGIPTLTFSSAPSPSITGRVPLSISTSLPDSAFEAPSTVNPSTVGESQHFLSTISSPALWADALELLNKHFGDTEEGEAQARRTWESWLGGSREWISPSQKALVREQVGVSAMGGI